MISVLMSVFNGAKFLSESIESILDQTWSDFEFIIVDDCSTDGSLNIIEGFAERDSRIQVIKNKENMGLTKSLIHACGIAGGTFIARQDSDDVSLPRRLESQLSFLQRNRAYGAVGTSAAVINEAGSVIKKAWVPKSWTAIRYLLRYGNCFLHGSMMFTREAYIRAGGYRKEFSLGQDYDLWLRISNVAKMGNIVEELYRWRSTDGSISAMKTDLQFKIGALALYDHRYKKDLTFKDDFEADSFIQALSPEERRQYDSCLRALCLRHGNISMAKNYLGDNPVNRFLIALTALMFNLARSRG